MGFQSIFEHAPLAAARCNQQGIIVDRNLAFDQTLPPSLAQQSALRLYDLVAPENHDTTEQHLRELFDSTRDSIRLVGTPIVGRAAAESAQTNWMAWRQPEPGENTTLVILVAEISRNSTPAQEALMQAQRWESVGRLAGGVVHDFNNLLTGVMLYCDLLLGSLDLRDCRRRYADEIRLAILQATGLVRQLLVLARPQASQVRALCLNQIAQAMQDLLARLIGENIVLESHLDTKLGLVQIDQAQAQQILLNLVLNARDALPDGGHIVIETSNCKFQNVPGSVASAGGLSAFPCVLLTVSDDGCGMDAKTRQRLFEPFFTTKSEGKGTGLGLSTVHSIVANNGGLIHVESEPGHGTRVMILLPRESQPESEADSTNISIPRVQPSHNALQEMKKEILL
jgi:signal transduction histidine kinase